MLIYYYKALQQVGPLRTGLWMSPASLEVHQLVKVCSLNSVVALGVLTVVVKAGS